MMNNQYASHVKQEYLSVPYITVRGQWLKDSGFNPGALVKINAGQGKLIITPDNSNMPPGEIVQESRPQKASIYKDKYHGYTVQLKLERNGDCKPVWLLNAQDVYHFLDALQYESREVMLAVMMDSRLRVVGVYEIGKGGIRAADASFFEMLKAAILVNSDLIILVHNHTSGDIVPSEHDIGITRNWKKSLALLELKLLDHIIIGHGRYSSMKELGYFK